MDVTTLVSHVIDAISLGSLYAQLALGIALIFGIMQLVNFAHGELIMVAAYALILIAGVAFGLVVLLTLLVAVTAAVAMERLAFRPARGASPATLLVTSFAVSFLLQNLAILLIGATPRSRGLPGWLTDTFSVAGVSVRVLDVLTVAVTALLLSGLAVFLSRTSMGIQMRAAAEDFPAARLAGVRANAVIAVAFGISGLLAGVSAIFLVAQTGTVHPAIGVTPVIVAFIATALGGMNSLVGAALGGFVLGVMSVTLQAALPIEIRPYRDALLFGAVMLMLFVRPQGLVVSRFTRTRV
jgi:branched-chain amino acid transport system permease protein